jgi:hypothetical protein
LTTSQKIAVAVRLVHVGDHVWRVQRADTGKVLGLVEGRNRAWKAKASMRAFLGDGPDGGEPLGDWVPRPLYAPLLASEGHHYLPGTHQSQQAAVAALQTYLDDRRAPAMGYGVHDQLRHQEVS